VCSSTNPKERIHLLELEPLGISQFYSRKSNYTPFKERYKEVQCREILSSAYPHLGTLFNFIANNSEEMLG